MIVGGIIAATGAFPVMTQDGLDEPFAVPGWIVPAALAVQPHAADIAPLPGLAGPLADPTPSAFAAAPSGRPNRGFGGDFYFRIWPIPPVVDVQNPRLNTDIPFQLWNAYLVANEIEAINTLNAAGLTLDVAAGDIFDELALQTVNVQITPLAPTSIDALFTFDMQYGGTTVRFIALLADILPISPNSGLRELWEWKTDILKAFNGDEQRIALRRQARRTFDIQMTLENDADRKAHFDKIYKVLRASIIMPTYQYHTRLKQPVAEGTDILYCNTRRADIRIGETVVVNEKQTGLQYVLKAIDVTDDYVQVENPISNSIQAGATVVGGITGRIANNRLSMYSKHGSANLTIEANDNRDTLVWPGASVTLLTCSGYPVVERRALSDSEVQENLESGGETIDNDTGKPQTYYSWKHNELMGTRRFLINRLFNFEELDYWRALFDYAKGSQNAFLLPTYRDDLFAVVPDANLPGQVEVYGSTYATQYFENPLFRFVQIASDKGDFYAEVETVENFGSTSILHFRDAIGVPGDLFTIERISYAFLVRIADDKVALTHGQTASTVEFNIQAAGV